MTSDPALFPYQLEGASILADKTRWILADEMGLGKTAQALTAAKMIKAQRILIICPAFLTRNWLREVDMWYPDAGRKVAKKWDTGMTLDGKGPYTIVASYNAFYAPKTRQEMALGKFDVIIIDEAHALKEPTAKRTKYIYGKRGVVHTAPRTWILTGTPMPNYPDELWTHTFVCGAQDMRYQEWVKKFCNYDPQWMRVTGMKKDAAPELKKILATCMTRRTKDMVNLELPPLYQHVVPLDIKDAPLPEEVAFGHPDGAQGYADRVRDQERMIRELVNRLTAENRADDIADELAKLQVAASPLRRYFGLCKAKAVAEILSAEMDDNAYEKVVVFAWHKDVVYALEKALEKYHPLVITGETSLHKRDEYVRAFQRPDSENKVMIANIAAAGTGLTLTAAHQVVSVEADWSPQINAQAYMRCHRIGQTKPVTIREFVMADTIDERVMQILQSKTRAHLAVFG